MATDWADVIAEARRRGVDATAEMSASDWAEYRGQCRAWLETEVGHAHKLRALDRIAAKRAILDEAS
ncbi:MAG: hypothetical protein R2761_15490 [Acidimicrobiales bacterium]